MVDGAERYGGVGDWFDEALGDVPTCLNFGSFDDDLKFEEERVALDGDDLPELAPVSDDEDGESDLEDELASDCGGEERVEEFLDSSGEAFVVAESVQTTGTAELYDSGCTNHISPYKDQFENFQSIVPRHFRALQISKLSAR